MGNNTETGATTSTETTTDTTTTDSGVDIQALLKLASATDTTDRVVDTIKLYQDKLNIATDSGVVVGSKYSVKVGGSTLIIYQDNKGTTTASSKGKQGIMLSLNKSVKNNLAYKQGVKQGKTGKTCKDYTVVHNTSNGVEYLLIDLQEYTPKTTETTETTETTDATTTTSSDK